jgi:hypothetical protein
MPKTYEPIATTTATGSSATITFSSIPQTYTDLVLVVNAGSTTVDNFAYAEFNNDTNISNYSYTTLYGNGTSALSARATGGYFSAYIGVGTAIETVSIVNIQNYTNASTFKTFLSRTSRATSEGTYKGTEIVCNLWRNTNAITTIKINSYSTYNFITGSTFTLYGIKAA